METYAQHAINWRKGVKGGNSDRIIATNTLELKSRIVPWNEFLLNFSYYVREIERQRESIYIYRAERSWNYVNVNQIENFNNQKKKIVLSLPFRNRVGWAGRERDGSHPQQFFIFNPQQHTIVSYSNACAFIHPTKFCG